MTTNDFDVKWLMNYNMEKHQQYHADNNDKFDPKFTWETDVNVVADKINLPHEDYPVRIDATVEEIRICIEHRNNGPEPWIDDKAMFSIHKNIMKTSGTTPDYSIIYPLKDDQLGKYRISSVRIRDKVMTNSKLIPEMMKHILPISVEKRLKILEFGNRKLPISTKEEAYEAFKQFYTEFQEIHPFIDGNGRVGGVIVAVMSYLAIGEYLTPKQ